MRLAILDRGHALGAKLLFRLIATMSRQPVPEMLKLVKYRPDFFGKPMGRLTHQAMRGPSAIKPGSARHSSISTRHP